MTEATRPVVLACAGHDPSGGAGVDADREAVGDCGGLARTVVTTDTDQDGIRVRGFRPRASEAWVGEARRCLAAEPAPRALKFGLLANREAVLAAAALAGDAAERGIPVVVDPVLVASGGERFLGPDGMRALVARLLPLGVVLTPNLHEAAELTGRAWGALVADAGERGAAAAELLERGASAVVVKGGHGTGATVRDTVHRAGAAAVEIELPRVPGAGIHGSGCRHASALATGLARGLELTEAARLAARYLAARIAALQAGPSLD